MTNIRIHQALYGYHEGHRAIVWSMPKTSWAAPEAVDYIDRYTDLGGYWPLDAPRDTWWSSGIPHGEHYVLMRTWHDTESEALGYRMGCCWTHALFIPMERIAEVATFGWLGHLFRRPTRGDWAPYKTMLDVQWPPPPRDRVLPARQRKAKDGEFYTIGPFIDQDQPFVWSGDETAEYLCNYVWRRRCNDGTLASFAFHGCAVQAWWIGKRRYDLVCMAHPSSAVQGNFYHEHRARMIAHPTVARP